ncbi:pentatricopeptide repeat-containing protein At1g09190-like [Zingiber officinale]|uniref:Pentatricopeptide repeat-containing protein n=1 Tax=Zingiber officinale TaxID=94328 RepID=A0A8J5L7Y1_ZINOF|nr:pentatricopeptide repeat-containing protein At1g09190-like [Zingiber officinale]KAG6508670.1 hypothetical protein ZIOFF_034050 [Zingiber officinale]
MSSGCANNSAAERRVLSLLHDRAARGHLPAIYGHVLRHDLRGSDPVATHLVSTCTAVRRPSFALRLFRHHPSPSLFLFSATIKALSLSLAYAPDAFHLFALLRSRYLSPDRLTISPLLKAAAHIADLRLARSLHGFAFLSGFASHLPVAVGLLELYNSCGHMSDAHKVFNEMPQRDVIAWNLMINGYCKKGDWESALGLFRRMNERSVVTWNSIIAGLARCGQDIYTLQIFHEMWETSGFDPDDATVVAVLPVCARLGELDLGIRIHRYAERKGLLNDALHVANSIIDMYCKCGDLASAKALFDEMPQRTVVSWNAMIGGMSFNGRGQEGLDLFDEMLRRRERPNGGTFVSVLGCCTHEGRVERGQEIFQSMALEHGVRPGMEHYGCMVDLLGRRGKVVEAYGLVRSMPMRANAAIWGALLSACRSFGELGMAEVAVKELIELEPWNSGNYVLLGNLLSEMGKWEEAEKVRLLMKGKSVEKSPGQSLVVAEI